MKRYKRRTAPRVRPLDGGTMEVEWLELAPYAIGGDDK